MSCSRDSIDAQGAPACQCSDGTVAGCCNSTTTPGCTFSSAGRSDTEYACAGGGITTLSALQTVWQNNQCPIVFKDILYTLPTSSGPSLNYNPAALAGIQADGYNLLSLYTNSPTAPSPGFGYSFTDRVGSATYNSFQNELIALCASDSPSVPGMCDLFLSNQNGYCSNFTREQIGADSALNMMCGCYAPSQTNNSAGSGLDPYIGTPNDPLCHLTSTVQKSNPCTGVIQQGDNTVCVIDDVNIQLVNSGSKVPVFTQICPACSATSPCTCIFSGNNVNNTLYQSGVGPTYQQFCGQNAQCITTTPTGDVATTCPAPTSFVQLSSGPTFPIVFIIIVVVLLIAAALIMLMTKHTTREIYKPQPGYSAIQTNTTATGAPQYTWMTNS